MGQQFRVVGNYDFKDHKVGNVIEVTGHGMHKIIAVSPIPNGQANFVLEKVEGNRKERRAQRSKRK